MTKTNLILLIIEIILVFIFLGIILYKYSKEKLDNITHKLDDAEEECVENLKNKFNIIMDMIKVIETKYKVESKAFDEAKKINIESINSFKDEKLLNKCYKEIKQVKEDNKKVKETKAFKEMFNKYEQNELRIISTRTYHNKYTLIYNNLIKKFPFKVLSKIKKYQIRSLIDGKEINNNFNNDLEV